MPSRASVANPKGNVTVNVEIWTITRPIDNPRSIKGKNGTPITVSSTPRIPLKQASLFRIVPADTSTVVGIRQEDGVR